MTITSLWTSLYYGCPRSLAAGITQELAGPSCRISVQRAHEQLPTLVCDITRRKHDQLVSHVTVTEVPCSEPWQGQGWWEAMAEGVALHRWREDGGSTIEHVAQWNCQ